MSSPGHDVLGVERGVVVQQRQLVSLRQALEDGLGCRELSHDGRAEPEVGYEPLPVEQVTCLVLEGELVGQVLHLVVDPGRDGGVTGQDAGHVSTTRVGFSF